MASNSTQPQRDWRMYRVDPKLDAEVRDQAAEENRSNANMLNTMLAFAVRYWDVKDQIKAVYDNKEMP